MTAVLDFDLEEAKRVHELRLDRSSSLLSFIRYTKPDYLAGWFHVELASKLDDFLKACVARESPRLIIQAPPRHGKSEQVSRRFPAYALGKHSDLQIIGSSYAQDLAARMNRDVQRIMDDKPYHEIFPTAKIPGRNVRTDSKGKLRNSDIFEMINGEGGYRAAGVGVGITGMGADILTIDDPVKDAAEASSKTKRDSVWHWYTSTAYTRLSPGGGVLIVMTRWHEDDLAGRLIEAGNKAAAGEDEDADIFEVVSYPAISTHEESHRKEGEALHPDRYDLKALRKIKSTLGSYYWSALYQQSPAPSEGDVFRTKWWKYWKALPPLMMIKMYADTAMKTKERNDYSVFQVWGLSFDGQIYLLDQMRGKWESPELEKNARAFWAKWKAHPMGDNLPQPFEMKIEDKSSGTGLIQSLQRGAGAIPATPIKREVDKLIRARSSAPSIEAGNVFLPDPEAHPTEFLSDYLAEFSSFTAAMSHKHDDQVDPTMDAIHDLILGNADFYEGAL